MPCFAAALPLPQGMVGEATLPLTLGCHSGIWCFSTAALLLVPVCTLLMVSDRQLLGLGLGR